MLQEVFYKFYIFKGERLGDDYIKLYKPKTYMAMQKKVWTTSFLFKEFLTFFKKFVLNGVFLTNRHLLVLDGHGSHVILKAIEHAQELGLDISTLPFHISHDLQPLDVSCFKQF
jgi:hypothetical protein